MGGYELYFNSLGLGRISLPGNPSISGRPEIDGYFYDFWYAKAEFTLANVSRTDISQVPLPAGGALILSGLFLLILRRRWGSQGLAMHIS